jgi:hypothetical protein
MTNLNVPAVADFTGRNVEVGINDSLLALDQAWRNDLTVDMSGGSAAPTVDQARRTMLYTLDNVGTSGGVFTFPALEKPFLVYVPNDATDSVDIEKGTTTITQAVGTMRWYRSGAGANDLWSPQLGGGAIQSAVGTDFLGVLVGIDADFAGRDIAGNTADEKPEWHRQYFDHIGAHDPATNPTRLTIPTGVTRVNFFWSCTFNEAVGAGRVEALITKNGGVFPGEIISVKNAINERICFSMESGPIAVSATDYFEIVIYIANAGTFNLRQDLAYFGFEVVGGPLFEGQYNAIPLDVKMPFFSGTPGTTTVIDKQVVTQNGIFPDDFAGSRADVGTNPSGTTTFDIDVNGSTVGTVAFDTSGNATFTTTTTDGTVAVSAGDRIEIVTQGSVNGIGDISIELKGRVE